MDLSDSRRGDLHLNSGTAVGTRRPPRCVGAACALASLITLHSPAARAGNSTCGQAAPTHRSRTWL